MPLPAEVVQLTDSFLAEVDARAPGLLTGLFLHGSLCWGELVADSDLDFVATLDREPTAADVRALGSAHAALRERFPVRRFEGFHCRSADLSASPTDLGPVPVHFQGELDPAGGLDVNLVTWHELAERGLVVRGTLPRVHTDLPGLLAYSHDNLATYWTSLLRRVEDAGDAGVGAEGPTVVWVVLGVARLHHLLARHRLTSKSGAGHYVLEALDPRWHPIATEALALREVPGAATGYADPVARGRDVRELLAWAVDDGLRRPLDRATRAGGLSPGTPW